MSTKQEAAMRQALEALEWCVEQGGGPVCEHESGGAVCFCVENKAITALREALTEQADRSGCTAGSDEECANRHCATKCPALAEQQAAEPVAMRYRFHYPDDGSKPYRTSEWKYTQGPWDKIPGNARDVSALSLHEAPTQQPLTDEQKAVLRECRNKAMKWTGQAGIPECGAFGGIAQDLDWLCGQLGIAENEKGGAV